jgi:hypothetical protein
MTEQPTPTARKGLMTQETRQVGGAARGWHGLRQLLADRWSGERPREVVRLWQDAQSTPQLPISIRVRAATALELVR